MIPGAFEYHAPADLAGAIALLTRYGDEAKLLAGGQSLIPMLRFRLAQPAHLIDVGRIDGLAFIREDDRYLRIGAMTREADLEAAPVVAERYPILLDTAAVIADPLVRNLATVGGNLAHADPANDHPATMLAQWAELVAQGPNGTRVIPVDEFFLDLFTTALAHDEILTEIRIPRPEPGSGGAYVKLERKVGDYAIAGVAAQLKLDAAGRIERAGIGLTNVGATPLRAEAAEAALIDQPADEMVFRAAGELAAQRAEPTDDLRGPADYKRAMIRTLTVRALQRAAERVRP